MYSYQVVQLRTAGAAGITSDRVSASTATWRHGFAQSVFTVPNSWDLARVHVWAEDEVRYRHSFDGNCICYHDLLQKWNRLNTTAITGGVQDQISDDNIAR